MPSPNPNPAPVDQWFELWYVHTGQIKNYRVVDTANITFSNPQVPRTIYPIILYEQGGNQNQYEVVAPTNSPVLIEWTQQSSGITFKAQTNTGPYGYTSTNSPDVVTLS